MNTSIETRDDRVGPSASLRRFGIVFGTLCAVLLLIGLVFQGALYAWWLESIQGPDIQRALGFTIERRLVRRAGGEQYPGLFVAEVRPGGQFDRAGVRAGDEVVCLHHGSAQFWGALDSARAGYETSFKVVSPEKATQGCLGARTVTIAP
jgi:hypothetical protein